MIRINLARSKGNEGKPAKALVSRREAITGAVLLVAAFGMLFYLASRQKPAAEPEPPPTIAEAEPVAKAPPEPKPEPKVEEPPPPPPPPKVEASVPKAPVPKERAAVPPEPGPETGCRVQEISVRKSGGSVTVAIRASAAVKYRSFELFKPDRIAVDMSGCVGAVPRAQASQAVGDALVQKIRANQFRADLYRVVLDVSEMPRYQVRALDAGVEIQVLGKKR